MTHDPKSGADDGKAHGSDAAAGPSSDGGGAAGFEEVLAEHLLAAEAGAAPDREAFIRRHPQWAAELKAFFADDDRAAGLLDHAAGDGDALATGVVSGDEQAGAVIGRYKVLERIGEGGMGVVYVAQQHQPVRRKVALKVIKAGMDSRQVVARFEAERQALALMDHPNIAKVLDGGTTDTGRPYFVMELVHGVPITEYCDRHKLRPRTRLELFVQVCQAVQHAHQKGVIHRDLKPTNVLVAVHDGQPVPKVIDFGVAKATGQHPLTDHTLFTQFAQMVGTPLYMSPEQAQVGGTDVDTRSDVYSLGVMLYELLTGTTPFDRRRLGMAALDEVRRIIREEEPQKPSTRLSTSDALPSIAANRGLDPRKLCGLVRGELDWIVMKCVEKERGRRYDTAIGLARDVERYLSDEPVQACPPSAAYRVRKFARRHRGPVVAAGLVVLALLGGLTGTVWQALRAERERAAAVGERDEKQAALDAEAAARRQAMAALRALTDDVVGRQMAGRQALGEADRTFLRAVVAQYDAFAGIKGAGVESRAIRAEGHLRVAMLQSGLGEHGDARGSFGRAVELFGGLVAEFGSVPGYRHDLGNSHRRLGALLADLGEDEAAGAEHRRAIAVLEPLVSDVPTEPRSHETLARSHEGLGDVLQRLGDRHGAEAEYRRALRLLADPAPGSPDATAFREARAAAHSRLGSVLEGQAAVDACRDALAVQKQLVAEFPDTPAYRERLGQTHMDLGRVLEVVGRRADAETEYAVAADICYELSARFPSVPEYRKDLVASFLLVGSVREGAHALYSHLRGNGIADALAKDFPDVPAYQQAWAASCNQVGAVFGGLGNHERAEQEHRRAVAINEKLIAASPHVPEHRAALARSHQGIGRALANRGRHAEAEAEFRLALDAVGRLATELPGTPEQGVLLGQLQCDHGELLVRSGRAADGLAWLERSVATLSPILLREPNRWRARLYLRDAHAGRASALEVLDRLRPAVADWDRAIELAEAGARPSLQYRRAVCLTGVEPAAAAAAAHELLRLSPDDMEHAFSSAPLLLLAGDREGYSGLCARLLSSAEKLTALNVPGRRDYLLARACLLAPDAGPDLVADPSAPLRLAGRAVDAAPACPWYLHTLALALYRAGRFEDAAGRTEESKRLGPDWAGRPLNELLAAMAQHRRGLIDEARLTLENTTASMDRPPSDRRGLYAWHRMPEHEWLAWALLRREAETLIRGAAR